MHQVDTMLASDRAAAGVSDKELLHGPSCNPPHAECECSHNATALHDDGVASMDPVLLRLLAGLQVRGRTHILSLSPSHPPGPSPTALPLSPSQSEWSSIHARTHTAETISPDVATSPEQVPAAVFNCTLLLIYGLLQLRTSPTAQASYKIYIHKGPICTRYTYTKALSVGGGETCIFNKYLCPTTRMLHSDWHPI